MKKLLLFVGCLIFGNLSLIAQTQTFNVIADASVYQGGVDANYHNSDLLVKKRNGNSVGRQAYLKFDLSNFNLSTVGQAKVRMYLKSRVKSEAAYVNANKVEDNSWVENQLKWSNKPAFSGVLSITKIEDAAKYYEWNITSFVKEIINNSEATKLITIAFTDELGADDDLRFENKEAINANIAQLVINEQPDNYDLKTYYINDVDGDDNNDGHSELTAFKTLAKINATLLQPGEKVLFKAGGIWTGQFKPIGIGAEGSPVIIDKYGEGPNPLIDGNGMVGQGVVFVKNFPFIEINNLEITNNAATEGDRRGVEITADNFGLIKHTYLRNLHIHHIKGIIGHDAAEKKTAGIYISTTNDNTVDTRFDDIRIENCLIHHIENQGIVTNSISVADYPGTPNFERRKITNLLVRNNVLHHISKNAMIIRMTDGGLVERNLCYETAIGDGTNYITGNTIFSRTVIGTVFQYNEGYLNRSPSYDGSLYDADLISPGTIWQYSYSHDNAHGLMWYCTVEQDTGVVVRYNVSQNDKGRLIYFNYDFASSEVYNNVFYIGEGLSPTIISENQNNSHNYKFYNNIIYNNSTTAKYSMANSGSGVQVRDYSHNIFYGHHPAGEPFDPFKITADPKFLNPGSGGVGLATLGGYKLQENSPALGAGKIVANNGGLDLYGNAVSATQAPNIGVYEGAAVSSMVDENFHLYLLVGQSNMAGRGPITGEYVYRSHPRVLMQNAEGKWVKVQHPIHYDKTAAAVGLAMEFAIEMANANPDITIGLIPAAVGGSPISSWAPGATDSATGFKPYDDAVSRTQTAIQNGVLKGILFHQGEANSSGNATSLNNWMTAVKNLASNLRTEFNNQKLPFVMGELAYSRSTSPNINNILPALKSQINRSEIVSAANLMTFDGTHFDSQSADILGRRYAEKMLALLSVPADKKFGKGNLAIVRAGDGSAANSAGAQKMFIDEYTTEGTFIQTLALPTRADTVAPNKALLAPDLNSNFGLSTLSTDGQYLVVGGYDANIGDKSVSTGSGERVIGIINANADISTKNAIDFGAYNLRSAVMDGNNIWAIGSGAGIKHIDISNPLAGTTTIATSPGAPRAIGIFNNQLYASSSTGSRYLYTVGASLPTASSQTVALLPGLSTAAGSPYQFVLFDTDGVSGPDLLYVVTDTAGLRKFYLEDTSWKDKGIHTVIGLRGLTGTYNAIDGVTLYGATNSEIIKFVDNAAPNAKREVVATSLLTSGANTTFKGITFTPQAIPEGTAPVDLVSFTAKPNLNGVAINWKTASEENNNRFEIYHSTSGKRFDNIYSLNVNGSSKAAKEYSYNHISPANGYNYYKLKQIDLDGKFKEYPVVAVNYSLNQEKIKAYVANGMLRVQAVVDNAFANATLIINDINGRHVLVGKQVLKAGENNLEIALPSLTPGVYILNLSTERNILTEKFIY